MRYHLYAGAAGIALLAGATAQAGEAPLYQPAPAWVVPAALPDPAKISAEGPNFVLIDMQQRVEGGRLWSYFDSATRIASPEMLSQMANLTIPWAPDKGDLIVHELAILRSGRTIDLIAQGQKFTVLRREQSLEQLELTGILTATLAIEGLQVGDILHVRASQTSKDDALGGRVQSLAPIIAAPTATGVARLRVSWPSAGPAPRWKIAAEGVSAAPVRKGDYTELAVPLPAPKQPEMPKDAPSRYQRPAMLEVSTFSGWDDVSKVMAPLYTTEGAIPPGSALAAEVEAIKTAEATPLGRAQRALELVQDKIRYLAVGMDGGNYVPQKPAKTWELRYGDCKAKTLLLLSLLRAMGIEAEPVLANSSSGDFVPERLPAAQAFDHVLVHATIGGESLWLDGTQLGSRLADIHDTPPFRYVLPVRAAGAGLVKIDTHATARPLMDVSIEADESASSDLPTPIDATAVLRGASAAQLTLSAGQLGEKQKREMIGAFFQNIVGDVQYSSASFTPDVKAGTVTLRLKGVINSPWQTESRRRKRSLARAFGIIEFSPDRSRPAWKAIPVSTGAPAALRFHLALRLPDGGRGFTLEGQGDYKGRIAGTELTRNVRLDGAMVTVDERIDDTGEEIAADRIAAERDALAVAKANAPRLVAPENTRRQWDIAGADPAGATQIKAIEATLAGAIAADADDASGYTSRAWFRSAIGDRKGALADLTKAIAVSPSVDLYLSRSDLSYQLGDLAAAQADAEAARQLDPSSSDAVREVAFLKAERGDMPGAVSLLDERIALGGDTKPGYRQIRADLIGQFGDPAAAVKELDALVAEKPGSPNLLNDRCWVKGTRSLLLDTALKDCTEAIELSSDTAAALDSRAMVWFRMGRYEEALRDLDALLAASPNHAASRYLRSIVLTRLHRDADAATDLAVARRLVPSVDRIYARYGLKAEVAAKAAGAARPAGAGAR